MHGLHLKPNHPCHSHGQLTPDLIDILLRRPCTHHSLGQLTLFPLIHSVVPAKRMHVRGPPLRPQVRLYGFQEGGYTFQEGRYRFCWYRGPPLRPMTLGHFSPNLGHFRVTSGSLLGRLLARVTSGP